MDYAALKKRLLERRPADAGVSAELSRFLDGFLVQVRWVVLAALLLLAIAQPLQGRTGLPSWALVLIFIGYNLVLELLRRGLPPLRSFARVPLLDLPVVAALYWLSATPGGPLFVLFLLLVASAAASMSIRNGLLYTAAVVLLVAAIAPTLPTWLGNVYDYRELGVELIVIGLVGAGTAVLVRQLARERLAAEESRARSERLAELDRLRTEFISTVSHNLRTPITAAKAGVGLLEKSAAERLDDRERRLIGNVQRNIERLDRHIGDLLALNQLEAGVLRLDQEPVDLRLVASDAVSAVQPQIGEKRQTLTLDLPDALPALADPWWIEQAVVNLLYNAHHHTPPGTSITVSGCAAEREVLLSVADDGPGVPAEARASIFEPFNRLDHGRSGSGLGLAIVKGIVALHGGRVWLDPATNDGARFVIALPRHE